ncbi:DUF6882 domain-containing protein [Providencia vermicola]|uniref:DUF6882 domain-containing protein n=1 Tax=Providencia vermicola TaxID=333965 RepID=UPI002FDFA4DA
MNQDAENLPYDILLARSMNALQHKSQFHCDTWKLDQASWSVDQEEGTIVFQAPDDIVAVAPVQIIGTYDQNQGNWLWGWANSSIEAPLLQDALAVQEFAERKGYDQLTEAMCQIDESEAWEFAALACELNERQGVYRGAAGNTLIFMSFGEVKLHKNNA